jgi:hypothetical protein
MKSFVGFHLRAACGLASLILASGCGEETPPKQTVKPRATLGKTTQEVRNLKPELA